jgi:hypothetical protein
MSIFWFLILQGIQVLQMQTPFKRGTIKVEIEDLTNWTLQTKNIRRFRMYEIPGFKRSSSVHPTALNVDGTKFSSQELEQVFQSEVNFVRLPGRTWVIQNDGLTFEEKERGPMTYGPARQVFSKPFIIVPGTLCLLQFLTNRDERNC